jgi:hypothetical protein
MKLLAASWGGIIVESAGFCRFLQRIGGGTRTPRAAVVWPFLIVRDQQEYGRAWLMNHEKIHLVQNTDLLVLGFDVLYFCEYVFARLVLRKTKEEAYYWFSHEQEAYLNQHDMDYLKTRRWGAQFKYLFRKKRFRVTDVPGEIAFY